MVDDLINYPEQPALVLGKSVARSTDGGSADIQVNGATYSSVPQAQRDEPVGTPIISLRIGRSLVGVAAGGYHVPE